MSAVRRGDRPLLVVGDPVVTLAGGGVIADGGVLCAGSRIEAIGRREELLSRQPDAEVLGSPAHVVLPGLVNSHFHSDFELDARWLRYPIERGNAHVRDPAERHEYRYWQTVQRGLRCLRAGQTTVLDVVYGSPGLEHLGLTETLRAYRDLGMRAAVAVALRDRNHYVHGADEGFLGRLSREASAYARQEGLGYRRPVEASLRAFEAMQADGHGKGPRSRLALAPDWTPSVSDELYAEAARIAESHDVPLTGHVAETRLEVEYSLREYGKTPVQRLADLGVLGERTSCAHSTWTTDADHRLLCQTGAMAVLNPGSNLRTGAGLPRAASLLASRVPVALGTDGMALQPESLLGEACLAAYLDRDYASLSDEPLDPLRLLESSQRTGARATGFGGAIGGLSPGGEADLVVLRPHPEQGVGGGRHVEGYELVERLRDAPVVAAVVAGTRVLEGAQPLGVDARDVDRADRDLGARPVVGERGPTVTAQRGIDDVVREHYRGWARVPVEPGIVPNARALRGPRW